MRARKLQAKRDFWLPLNTLLKCIDPSRKGTLVSHMILENKMKKLNGHQAAEVKEGAQLHLKPVKFRNTANNNTNTLVTNINVTKGANINRKISLPSNIDISKSASSKIMMSFDEWEKVFNKFDDLEKVTAQADLKTIENILVKYGSIMTSAVDVIRKKSTKSKRICSILIAMSEVMVQAWKVPAFGHEIGYGLCAILKNSGGLDFLINSCVSEKDELQFSSAKLLHQCFNTENRDYVVENGLSKVVTMAKKFTGDIGNSSWSQVGTGILEHLFRHSEVTCSDVIAMGGLDTVVNECKSTDVLTLRQCASALANVAMYGGSENQEAMIKRKVPMWLFPLAFHIDDTVKYFACLAIAVLVANKEIEAEVQKSGTLELIEPFVQSHTPAEFAATSSSYSHGQSPNWLRKLIPVLNSHREEARNLAAFHFCMEAEIKKQEGNTNVLVEIGCVESLRKLASGPNGIAAKYAAQTLRLVGEEVPHKLSQQVPTWSVEDVREWVKQIGFANFALSFVESRVDGDLLLQLSEEMLRDDIGIKNGILRKRFLRELLYLKRMADYSSCDKSNLCRFLTNLGAEFAAYAYDLIKAGIDRDTLLSINEEQLLGECGIQSTIHRLKILQGVKVERGELNTGDDSCTLEKNLDVFISYRQPGGSQLASLLKVHLELHNFSVFLDWSEAGQFDTNLLQTIKSARNFILVLTPGALDSCIGDDDQHDWIHREVACALAAQCKVIPIFDNFVMPEASLLPTTMRAICSYNGVKWIHDYQDACVDKIDRFIRGDHVMERFHSSGGGSQRGYQRAMSCDSTKAASATSSSEEPSFAYDKECLHFFPPSPMGDQRRRWPRPPLLTKSASVGQRLVPMKGRKKLQQPMIFGSSNLKTMERPNLGSIMSTPGSSSIDNFFGDPHCFGRRRSLSLDNIGCNLTESEFLPTSSSTLDQDEQESLQLANKPTEMKSPIDIPTEKNTGNNIRHISEERENLNVPPPQLASIESDENLLSKSLSTVETWTRKSICDRFIRPRSNSLGILQIYISKWKKVMATK